MKSSSKKIPELLAPAGSFDALKAAVESGANAVYLAGENFGARAYAENFSRENLIRAVRFAHIREVAVHVTVNTIMSDDELEKFADYIKFLRRAKVDAFLVQDFGAAKIAKDLAPEISLHASTQMTIHNSEGVAALAELGFSRVVLSREMTLPELESITKNSPIETEIFIHGALCICRSGQCLMSSMIGARSGNRGRCAQPCRLPYELVDADGKNFLPNAGKYLLSPRDLNTVELLPRFVELGIDSLKIEGRMKRPEYVAAVVGVYRRALDNFAQGKNFFVPDEDRRKLAQIFNRDFTTAYLEKNPGKDLIGDKRPNNRGILIGRVAKVERGKIFLKLTEKIHAGDQIEIWVKTGGRVTFTVGNFETRENLCVVEVANVGGVKIHDRAFKILDAELMAETRKFFTGEAPIKKFPVDCHVVAKIGEPLTLTMTDADGNFSTAQTNFVAEPARNRPLNFETLQKQIGRLGNSIFRLQNLTADIEENLMVPVSELNEVRRIVTTELENLRLEKFEAKKIPVATSEPEKIFEPYRPERTEFVAQVDTEEKIRAAISAGADAILYGGETFNHRTITPEEISRAAESVRRAGKKFYLATPRIVREKEFPALEKILSAAKFDAVYVHSLATFRAAKKFSDAPIHTDFSLIVFNGKTIEFLKNLGVAGVTLSPELTLAEVKKLADKSPLPVECIVHGRTELMISDYCIPGSFLGEVGKKNCPGICRRNKFYLRDRKNLLFPVATDQFCRMHILNSKTLSMIEHRNEFDGVAKIRADCRALTVEETEKIIRAYKITGAEIENFTRGHFFRGVTSPEEEQFSIKVTGEKNHGQRNF